jgi:hypothetical protein
MKEIEAKCIRDVEKCYSKIMKIMGLEHFTAKKEIIDIKNNLIHLYREGLLEGSHLKLGEWLPSYINDERPK